MNIEEKDVGAAVIEARGRVFHFHTSENDRGAPGSGHVNWSEVADALRAIEYDEVISVESFASSVPGLQTAVSMWRPFFEDRTPSPASRSLISSRCFPKGGQMARPSPYSPVNGLTCRLKSLRKGSRMGLRRARAGVLG